MHCEIGLEYVSSVLRDNRGLCFVVDLSSSELAAFGSVILNITAYSNMWGEYSDLLTCKVSSMILCTCIAMLCAYSPLCFISVWRDLLLGSRLGKHSNCHQNWLCWLSN